MIETKRGRSRPRKPKLPKGKGSRGAKREARRTAIFFCVRRTIETSGLPPTYREITAETGYSSGVVLEALSVLAVRGYIRLIEGRARGIVLTDKGKRVS